MERVSWADSNVYTALSRKAIQNGPEYIESAPITREDEDRLYSHYGRPPYWLHEANPSPLKRRLSRAWASDKFRCPLIFLR